MKNNIKQVRTEIFINQDEQSTINDIIVKSIKKHIKKNEKIINKNSCDFKNDSKLRILLLCIDFKHIKALSSEIKKAFSEYEVDVKNIGSGVDISINGHLLTIGYISEKKLTILRFSCDEYTMIVSNFVKNVVSKDELDFVLDRLISRNNKIKTEALLFNS